MNKNLVYALLIIGGFFGIMYLLDHLNEEYTWYKGFRTNGDQPYDVSLLYNLLEDEEFEVKNEPIYNYLHLEKDSSAIYFLLSDEDNMNSKEERDSLLSFVARGNTAFVAVNSLYSSTAYNTVEEAVEEPWKEEEEEEEETEYYENEYTDTLVEEVADTIDFYQELEHEEDIDEEEKEEATTSYNEYNSEEGNVAAAEENIDSVEYIEDNFDEYADDDSYYDEEEYENEAAPASNKIQYNYPLAKKLNLTFQKFNADTVVGKVNEQYFSFSKKEVVYLHDEKKLGTVKDDYFFMEETSQVKVLGRINDKANLVEIQHGKGKIYFYSSPILLTNYSLVKPQGFSYAQEVLKVIPKGKKILWDEYNRSYHYDVPDYQKNKSNRTIKSPLSFIFENRSLKAAYYSILGTAVLFVVFYARRKQRAIPIILEKKNNSVEFAKTIGTLYLQSNHHKYIVGYQMKHLLVFIKSKYKLQLKGDLDDFVSNLSSRSEIDKEQLLNLFTKYQSYQEKSKLSDEQFLSFNTAISYFYSNCK